MTSTETAERQPLKELELDKNLRQVVRRANESRFYRELWKTAGVNLDKIKDLRDLPLLPLFNREKLSASIKKMMGGIGCVPANTWFGHLKPPNSFEWFPFSERDFLSIAPQLSRLTRVTGLKEGDRVLAVVDSTPQVSSVIPFIWTTLEASKTPRLEFITVSLRWYDTLDMAWIEFIQRRRPSILFTSTQNAVDLAEKIQKTLGVQPKAILPKLKASILYGEPLEGYRTQLKNAFASEFYEVYSPLEHMSFSVECNVHDGIHLWLDTCVPEIITSVNSDTQLLWEAPAGTMGELVLTNFSECLPLIRFRTGEMISVVGTDFCPCGCTHPRIKRLMKSV